MPSDPVTPDSCESQLQRAARDTGVECRDATVSDLEEMHELLRSTSLPTQGVDENLVAGTCVLTREGRLAGCAAVEVHGRFGLLRSVIVSPEIRGQGWGRILVQDRVSWARHHGLKTLFLFTETAAGFFGKLGFESGSRDEFPLEVRGSVEFDICPVTSVAMQMPLRSDQTSRIAARYSEAANTSFDPKAQEGAGAWVEACGYASTELSSLPETALASWRGCGNPFVVANLQEGENVLDLGCGGGLDVLLSARRVGPTGFVYGIDSNPDMLSLAEHNLAQSGAGNVRLLRGEIESLPLESNHVDVVISNCVVNLSSNKTQVFREAFRVLKPGGRLAIADILATEGGSDTVRHACEQALGCLSGTVRVSETETMLAEIGFVSVDIEPLKTYEADELAVCAQKELESSPAEAGGLLVSAIVRAQKPHRKGVSH